jgi:hypothetical protein
MENTLHCTAKIENIQTGASEISMSPCAYTITADIAAPGTKDQTVITVRTPDSERTVNLPIVNDTLHVNLSTLASLLKVDAWDVQCILGELVEHSVIPCAEIGWDKTVTPYGTIPAPVAVPILKGVLIAQSSKSLNSGMVVAWLKDVMRGWLDEKMRGVGR